MKVRNPHGKKAHGSQGFRVKRHPNGKWSRGTKPAKRAP